MGDGKEGGNILDGEKVDKGWFQWPVGKELEVVLGSSDMLDPNLSPQVVQSNCPDLQMDHPLS